MTVLVVGAGPTGLTLACALLDQGVDVAVIDKAAEPATTSRALVVLPRGLEVLERVGALGDLPDRAIGVRTMAIHADRKRIAAIEIEKLFSRIGVRPPLLVSQVEVEAALRKRFDDLGGRIEWGTVLESAKQNDDGVVVVLGGGESRTVDWLVGCDGAHSAVRKSAGIGFPGRAGTERFLLADVVTDFTGDRSTTRSWLHKRGMMLMFPLPGKDLWRVIADVSVESDTDSDPSDEQILAQVRRAVAERAGLTDVVVGQAKWVSNFRISQRLADRYRSGRMLVIGDAAHIHSPLGGQGMNTGLGDAENLAWKLALVQQGRANASLLDTVEAERKPIAKAVLTSTEAMTRLTLARNPLLGLARKLVLPRLVSIGYVRNQIADRGSQMSVNYRGGPLAGETRKGLSPGDPVPGLAPTTGWTVVGSARNVESVAAQVQQRFGAVNVDVFDRPRDTLVIRPDGHLAWRSGGQQTLDAWFEAALG